MVSTRTADQPARFTVPAVDESGSAIAATAAGWELFDERGNLIASDVVTGYAGGDVAFTIPADKMALADGKTSSGREIVVTLETDDGDVELRDYFVLAGAHALAVMDNSFMSYVEAIRWRGEFASMDAWDAAPRERRLAAMTEAYRRICKIAFKVPGANLDGTNVNKANYGTGTDEGWFWGSRVRISTLTASQFDALPEAFTRAVKRAQLVEANVLLGGDPIGSKRKQGLVSETIGESSMFFQSRPYLNLPVTKEAYEELRRFITLKVGVVRG